MSNGEKLSANSDALILGANYARKIENIGMSIWECLEEHQIDTMHPDLFDHEESPDTFFERSISEQVMPSGEILTLNTETFIEDDPDYVEPKFVTEFWVAMSRKEATPDGGSVWTETIFSWDNSSKGSSIAYERMYLNNFGEWVDGDHRSPAGKQDLQFDEDVFNDVVDLMIKTALKKWHVPMDEISPEETEVPGQGQPSVPDEDSQWASLDDIAPPRRPRRIRKKHGRNDSYNNSSVITTQTRQDREVLLTFAGMAILGAAYLADVPTPVLNTLKGLGGVMFINSFLPISYKTITNTWE